MLTDIDRFECLRMLPGESNIEHRQTKRTSRAIKHRDRPEIMSTKPSGTATEPQRDPVCGMSVNRATAKHSHAHAGKDFFFCCAGCADKFRTDPEKYLSRSAPSPSGLVMLGAAASRPAISSSPAQNDSTTFAPQAKQAVRAPMRGEDHAPSRSAAYVCPMCPEVRE